MSETPETPAFNDNAERSIRFRTRRLMQTFGGLSALDTFFKCRSGGGGQDGD